jgi:hypothetical protein
LTKPWVGSEPVKKEKELKKFEESYLSVRIYDMTAAAEFVEGPTTFWLNLIGGKDGRAEVKALSKSARDIKKTWDGIVHKYQL